MLNVIGRGADLAEARDVAYASIGQLHWPGIHHRTDIAEEIRNDVQGRSADGLTQRHGQDAARRRHARALRRRGRRSRQSAHRTPAKVTALASTAREDGYAAFICGAGMAAHLAGVVAAHTTLPVVGVPLSGGALNGVDALYTTVQMPKGIPVATVAIDGSMNAALLVVEMLAISDAELAAELAEHRVEIAQARGALGQSARVGSVFPPGRLPVGGHRGGDR